MQLHRRDVVAAAATILDNYGIADLTMRRLARELDITPGALYWHFDSKQALLGAVADSLLENVTDGCEPADGGDWRSWLGEICTRMRDALRSHTDGAELVSASFSAGKSVMADTILRELAAVAAQAGLDPEHAELAGRTVIHYVLGFTADEQSRLQWNSSGALADAQPMSGQDGRFAFGLRLFTDGLAVHGRIPVS